MPEGVIMTTTVTYAGISLEVAGNVIPASKEGKYEPEQQSYIDEMLIKVNGTPITELISDSDFSAIETLALEGLR